MYDGGLGVTQDYVKAVEWFEKAAHQGDPKAQFNLGLMYVSGIGVRQNFSVAKEYFGRACDNGEQKGCDEYRKLNETGH